MGKRKSREFTGTSCESFERLSTNFAALDKLRLDLEQTFVKQHKLIRLLRNEIPDAADHTARNLIQELTDQVSRLLNRSEETLTLSFDLKIRRYVQDKEAKDRLKKRKKTKRQEAQAASPVVSLDL